MAASTYTLAMHPEMRKALKKAAHFLSKPLEMKKVTPADIVRGAVSDRLNEIFAQMEAERGPTPIGVRQSPRKETSIGQMPSFRGSADVADLLGDDEDE